LEAQYRLPHVFSAGPADVEIETLAVSAGAGWVIASAGRLAPYTWVGIGPDVVDYGTARVDDDEDLVKSAGDRRVRASAAAAMGAAIALSPDLALRLEGRVQVPFFRARYRVDYGGGRRHEEARAWPVQPGMFVVFDTSRARP